MTDVTDLFGENIAYTLDGLGNRTQINVSNASPTAVRKSSAVFDALSRKLQDIGGVGQTTAYTYDANGNGLTLTDPLQHTTQRAFDALNRPVTVTDPAGGVTSFAYDAYDRITSVTDANGNNTAYYYDGFGDLIQQTSPVTGRAVYTYDLDGNMTQTTDADGAVTNHTYDALDRVLTASYPADSAENVSSTYDQGGHGFGVGRLTGVVDAAGTLSSPMTSAATG